MKPINGIHFCGCGCKYWNEDGSCVDCGGRYDVDYDKSLPAPTPCLICGTDRPDIDGHAYPECLR